MPQTIRTAGCALALLLLSLTVFTPAIAQAPSNKYGFCHGLAGNPRVNNYTRVFALGPSSPPDAATGFVQMLHKKYAGFITPEIACQWFATAADAETAYGKLLDSFAIYSKPWPLVESDWIPQGGSQLSGAAPALAPAPVVAAPAPAAAKPVSPASSNPARTPASGAVSAPTAAPTYWSACQIIRYAKAPATGYTTYISDVFPSDLKTADGKTYQDHHALLLKAYGEFISTKYGRERDNPQCNVMASEEKMRAIYKNWIDQANKDGNAVMTGWKYAPQ